MAKKDMDLTVPQMMKKDFFSLISTIEMVIPVLKELGKVENELIEKNEKCKELRKDLRSLKTAQKNISDTKINASLTQFIKIKENELEKIELVISELVCRKKVYSDEYATFSKYSKSIKFYEEYLPQMIDLDSFNINQIVSFAFAIKNSHNTYRTKNSEYEKILNLSQRSWNDFIKWIKYDFEY